MASISQPSASTSASLLRRVRSKEPDAWMRFATIYTPLVYNWARRGGLQPSDAADVVQEVFRLVFARLGDFQKDGQKSSFRGWLWAITRNCVRLHYRQLAARAQAAGRSEAAQMMAQLPSVWQQEAEPSTANDQYALVRRVLLAIREDFAEQTWQAFWRLAIDGQTAADISADLNLSVSAVRQAKYRVLCRLREELSGL